MGTLSTVQSQDSQVAPGLLEQETRSAMLYASNIVETIREPLVVLNGNFRIKSAKRSFYRFFNLDPRTTVGKTIYELGTGQWDIKKLKYLLDDIIPNHSHFENFEVEYKFPGTGWKTMLLNARQMVGQEHPPLILLALEDVT